MIIIYINIEDAHILKGFSVAFDQIGISNAMSIKCTPIPFFLFLRRIEKGYELLK